MLTVELIRDKDNNNDDDDDDNDEISPTSRRHTCVSHVAVTDDLIGACVKAAGITVLIFTERTSRAHAWSTWVSGTRPRVSIVTVGAPVNKRAGIQHTHAT